MGWIGEFVKQNGLVGTLLLLFVLDKLKIIDKFNKKYRNKPISEDHPHRRAEDNEETIHYHRRDRDDFVELKKLVQDHLAKEALEDIRMGVMESEQKNFKENLIETKEEISKIFEILGEIKTLMIKDRK